ncbi:MAG: hypothetical protein J2O38_05165, partial [Acidimicrobiales bacterium]|nr:hypothetical protein [Acidimicrobiales bacterium]
IRDAVFPSLREYTAGYGLTAERARLLGPDTLVMHPGPMNRGVELAAEVADLPCSVITRQVEVGVAVRMAVLFWCLWPDAGPRGIGPDAILSTGPGLEGGGLEGPGLEGIAEGAPPGGLGSP